MGAGIYKYLETCLWTHFLLSNVGVPIKYVHRHLEKNIVWALFLPSNVGTFSGLQCGGAHHSGLTTSPNQWEVSSPPPTLTPNASKPTRSQQRKKDRNPEAVFGAVFVGSRTVGGVWWRQLVSSREEPLSIQ